jgi:hypothetical protein
MRRVLVPLVLLALTTAGCSGDTKDAEPRATFSPPTVETETPTPTPTPTPSATPSPTPSATPAARRIPALNGDVDGDGTKDSVRATAELLTVELSGGGTLTAPVHADSPRSAPVLGYADIDRDGYSEVFLETAEGASTLFVTPYRYDGKALSELTLDEGPARLGIGGSVTHGDGFRCTGGTLQVLSSDSQDGSTYTVHTSTYKIVKAALVLVSSKSQQAKQGDAIVEASYQPDCGSVGG